MTAVTGEKEKVSGSSNEMVAKGPIPEGPRRDSPKNAYKTEKDIFYL